MTLIYIYLIFLTIFCWILQRPHKSTFEDMTKFHREDYIRFLRSIRPDNMTEHNKQLQRCKPDTPKITEKYLKTDKYLFVYVYFNFLLIFQSTLVTTVQFLTVSTTFANSRLEVQSQAL